MLFFYFAHVLAASLNSHPWLYMYKIWQMETPHFMFRGVYDTSNGQVKFVGAQMAQYDISEGVGGLANLSTTAFNDVTEKSFLPPFLHGEPFPIAKRVSRIMIVSAMPPTPLALSETCIYSSQFLYAIPKFIRTVDSLIHFYNNTALGNGSEY